MKLALTLLSLTIFLSCYSQDTVLVDRLIHIRKDSVSNYKAYFNDTLFSGIAKDINLIEWDRESYLTFIPKGDTIRGIYPDYIPTISYRKPHEYIVTYREYEEGVQTLNETSWINGEISKKVRTNRKKTGYSISYHFEKGDTIPGKIAWKFRYKKGKPVWSIQFDRNGNKVKKVVFWQDGEKRAENSGPYKKVKTY